MNKGLGVGVHEASVFYMGFETSLGGWNVLIHFLLKATFMQRISYDIFF